jgi:phosphomannomutase/phosphoglucomutase
MANKKTRNPAKEPDTAKASKLLQSIITTGTAIALLALGVSFVYLAAIDRPANNQSRLQAMSQNIATTQAAVVSQSITTLQVRLESFAHSTALAAALDDGQIDDIIAFEQELERAFPLAISARLITLGRDGTTALQKEKLQLRNNIEMDLLRRANNGEAVKPEAYKYQNQWLLSLTQAIKTEGSAFTSGAALITFDTAYLINLINQLDSVQGKTSLVQKFQQQQTIVTAGDSNNAFKTSANTSFDHWQVSFSPSQQFIDTNGLSGSLLWIMLAVSAVTVVLAFIFVQMKLQQALTANLKLLASFDKRNNDYTLSGFEQLATQLKGNAALAGKPGNKKGAPEAAKETIKAATPSTPVVEELFDNIPDEIPSTIFRAYDIRGIAETELSDGIVTAIGQAIGSEALDQGQQTVIVAADGRHSSPRIRDALIKGLIASGRDVIDIGMVPTPLMYFATHQLDTQSGVMITGSHNPAEYNGIKIVIGGRALSGPAIQALRDRILNRQLASGQGNSRSDSIEESYVDTIINDVAIAQPLKIVLDAGNGVAGAIAPRLFEELGCEVIPLYCEVDGDFPNHHPDPSVAENLTDLIATVKSEEADLGIAFDGDGDRLGVVTATGVIVPADRLLMLLAQDVVSRNPGADILFDVKCTRNLNSLISNYGGRPIMWKTGHSFMKEKIVETGALLGGEFSGHIFFKERWFGFDDGMYAAARLIEILSTTDPDLDVQLEAFPETISTPELKIESTEDAKFSIIEQLAAQSDFGDGKVSTLDGVRVDFPDGWGLVRASNTTPMLVLRFEADTDEALTRIQKLFKDQLNNIDNTLDFGF